MREGCLGSDSGHRMTDWAGVVSRAGLSDKSRRRRAES